MPPEFRSFGALRCRESRGLPRLRPLRRLRPDLPRELCAAVDACLQTRPDRRPSLEQLGGAIESSLDHLAPLLLREPDGGIVMTGRLATQVAKNPRVHLVGYGPSASTIGANRAGGAAVSELLTVLGLP